MKTWFSFFLLCAAWCGTVRAGVDVNTGSLLVRGGTLQSEDILINSSAALYGNGTLEAQDIQLDGTIAPCGTNVSETGTLQLNGLVTLNGLYICKVNAHSDLDLLSGNDIITGSGEIELVPQPAAIPLDQVLLEGSVTSVFSSMALIPAQTDLFRLTDTGAGQLLLTDLTGDSNIDGLPDWWEQQYFGGRTNCVLSEDEDGDASRNIDEYGAGTDPTNSASVLAVAQIELVPSSPDVIISWSSVTGKTYAIERAVSASPELFAPIASAVAATPPANAWTNSVPSAESFYYRVRVE